MAMLWSLLRSASHYFTIRVVLHFHSAKCVCDCLHPGISAASSVIVVLRSVMIGVRCTPEEEVGLILVTILILYLGFSKLLLLHWSILGVNAKTCLKINKEALHDPQNLIIDSRNIWGSSLDSWWSRIEFQTSSQELVEKAHSLKVYTFFYRLYIGWSRDLFAFM